VAEYDTKGTRLTCLTLADGAVDVTVAEKGESNDEEDEEAEEEADEDTRD
jgi:protein MAK11